MQLQTATAKLSQIRAFATPITCARCGESLVAPLVSEFVEGGEIRHHWLCDACGTSTSTTIELDDTLAE